MTKPLNLLEGFCAQCMILFSDEIRDGHKGDVAGVGAVGLGEVDFGAEGEGEDSVVDGAIDSI